MRDSERVPSLLLILFAVVLLVAGCALPPPSPRPSDRPPLHSGPNGTFVPGDTSYHGSGGP